MGDNSFGQLGIGNNNYDSGRGEEREFDIREQPTRLENLSNIVEIASGHHSAALTNEGTLYFWGTGVFGSFFEPKLVVDLDIIQVSIGGCFGAALDRDGLVWTWGSNSNGELGLGDYEP